MINNDSKEVLLRMFERLIELQQQKLKSENTNSARCNTISDEGIQHPHPILASTLMDLGQQQNVTIGNDGVLRISMGNIQDEISLNADIDAFTEIDPSDIFGESNYFT